MSVEVSHIQKGSLFAEDQQMRGDLKELSNLEELRHSFQTAMDKLVKDIELTLQETQNNDNKRHKKQQQVKMQGAMRDIPTSYFISDNITENMDAKNHTAHLDVMGRTSSLQSEVSTNVEEQKELRCMQVTAADIELQRMWCNFVLAEQKYEYEDSDKKRLHKERMARIHQQFSQGLQDRLLPPNQNVLFFLYCFTIMFIIYIVEDLVFYFFQNHHQFSFAIVFFFILKGIFQD